MANQIFTCDPCPKPGVDCEQWDAMADIRNIMCEYGSAVTFQVRTEANIDRDRYGSIKTRRAATTLIFQAHPIEFNPSSDVLEQAGLRHEVRVMVWTAYADWILNDLFFNDINEKRLTAIIEGDRYEVVDKNRVGKLGDQYLYLVFGFNKV